MPDEPSQDDLQRHRLHLSKAHALAQDFLLLGAGPLVGTTTEQVQDSLVRAMEHAESALAIMPDSLPCLFLMGKIYQRLEEPEATLHWFARAVEAAPDDANAQREAGLAALDAGQYERAVTFQRAAARLRPGDCGLRSNLAMALCLAGERQEAAAIAREAAEAPEADAVCRSVERLIGLEVELRDHLAERLDLDPGTIGPTSDLMRECGVPPIDLAEALAELEQDLGMVGAITSGLPPTTWSIAQRLLTLTPPP